MSIKSYSLCLIAICLCLLSPTLALQYHVSKTYPLRFGTHSTFTCYLTAKKGSKTDMSLEKTELNLKVLYHRKQSNTESRLNNLKEKYFKKLFTMYGESFFSSLLFKNPHHNGELYWRGHYDSFAAKRALAKRFNLSCQKLKRGVFDLTTEEHFIKL